MYIFIKTELFHKDKDLLASITRILKIIIIIIILNKYYSLYE